MTTLSRHREANSRHTAKDWTPAYAGVTMICRDPLGPGLRRDDGNHSSAARRACFGSPSETDSFHLFLLLKDFKDN